MNSKIKILPLILVEIVVITAVYIIKRENNISMQYMLIPYIMNHIYLCCCYYYVASASDKIIQKHYSKLYEKYKNPYTSHPSFVAAILFFTKEEKDDRLKRLCKSAKNYIIYNVLSFVISTLLFFIM